MASIEINNLQPAGSELFEDSESFLNELTDREMWGVQGGLTLDTLVLTLPDTISDPLTSATAGTLTDVTGGTLGLSIASL